jgi:hypothetical protein
MLCPRPAVGGPLTQALGLRHPSKYGVSMSIPKVFVSYSHDSQEHKKWVLDFATRLRNTGVDAALDQWDLKPGDDLPHFMETHLAACDRVLMICTDAYVKKANAGTGGVGYEKMIITADLLKRVDSSKVIPIIRQTGTHDVPTFLKSKLFIDFSRPDQFEFSYDELIRSLHNSPLFVKPPVGNNPFVPVENLPQDRTGDAIRELMAVVIKDFQAGNDYSNYLEVLKRVSVSRVFLDLYLAKAKDAGLLTQDSDKDLRVTTKVKLYAVEHGLA